MKTLVECFNQNTGNVFIQILHRSLDKSATDIQRMFYHILDATEGQIYQIPVYTKNYMWTAIKWPIMRYYQGLICD